MSSRSSNQKREAGGERVQKVLANAGFASRREIDRLIQSGRVVIDGRPAVPGDRLVGTESVVVDGRRVPIPDSKPDIHREVLLYHKPAGEITARQDPEGRPTVFAQLPKPRQGRWITVGRLDLNTSGLLLFTGDGELAHRLMHPSYEIDREYAVRVRGTLTDAQLAEVTRGIVLDDGMARFDRIVIGQSGSSNSWYNVVLREGRNREVRRVFEAIGVTVSRLIRVRYGPIELGRLQRGRYRMLDDRERDELYAAVEA